MEPPRFSVIVPTFNRAGSIAHTLESLRVQSSVGAEIIVVDDGSTDDTADVVKRLEIPRLRYEWQPNAGPSVARNRGAELAVGRYLAFLDTGDVAHPDWLEGFDTMFRAYGCSIVSCGADFVRHGQVVRTVLPRRLGPGSGRVVGFFRAGCFAVTKELFDQVGGFDPVLRFSEVSELGMRLGQAVAGRAGAATHLARSTVSVDLPPIEGRGGRATSLAYSDQRRLDTAVYILDKHREVMAATPSLRRTYLRVAGVAAARLGSYGRARRFFLDAWRAGPRELGELARAGATCVPGLRERFWPAHG